MKMASLGYFNGNKNTKTFYCGGISITNVVQHLELLRLIVTGRPVSKRVADLMSLSIKPRAVWNY
jgi:hypothetical protein